MNLIQQLEAEAIEHFSQTKTIPEFRPGDTLRVGVKVVEGERTRIQNFEGVCIARANRGLGSSFTVRKISFGEGVERVFPLYSPNVDSIEVVRRGAVRRAKLYYLRGRTGKSARIAERRDTRHLDKAEGRSRDRPRRKPPRAEPRHRRKTRRSLRRPPFSLPRRRHSSESWIHCCAAATTVRSSAFAGMTSSKIYLDSF